MKLYKVKVLKAVGAAAVYDINDAGQLAGQFTDGHAFRWDPKTGITHLHPHGSVEDLGYSINAHGHVVGWAWNGDLHNLGGFPFLYDGHQIIDLSSRLHSLGYDGGGAWGINDDGDIVGWGSKKQHPSHDYGWLLKGGTHAVDLNHQTGHQLVPTHINNRGRMIGYTGDKSAFWCDATSSQVTKIAGDFLGINNAQQIVGVASTGQAMLYHNGAIKHLTVAESEALDINDAGLAVGNRTTSGFVLGFFCDTKSATPAAIELGPVSDPNPNPSAGIHAGGINNAGTIFASTQPPANPLSYLDLLLTPTANLPPPPGGPTDATEIETPAPAGPPAAGFRRRMRPRELLHDILRRRAS